MAGQYYGGIAPSFEALLREFVIDPIALDPKSRENRHSKILGYWQNIYADTKSVLKTYEATRKWAQRVFTPNPEAITPAFPKYPDEEADFWSGPTRERRRLLR